MSFTPKRIFALALMFALVLPLLAACGGQPAAQPTAAPAPAPAATDAPAATAAPAPAPPAASNGVIALPEIDPTAFSGNIIIAGSSTVFPLTERMAELFKEDGFAGQITIDSIGSGAGYERFCVAAESDIANASRPIRQAELDNCAGNNRPAVEFRVGTDALAVVASRDNDFVDGLTEAQIADIFSGVYTTWNQVDASFPNQPIQLFSPGTDSGTFDYFVEHFFDSDPAPLLAANPQLSEDDNVLVAGVEGSPYAIGYFGYAYYAENTSRLKILSVDGVEASAENVENGSYSLARPLFIYSAAEIMAAKPQVAAFINYYLTFVNEEVIDVVYFPPSTNASNVARCNWLSAQP
ncbi:MAG: PstS family phosphate ABC transporter substrate-binding protein [Oscillochloridaceae bacterium umkhey_bin13]